MLPRKPWCDDFRLLSSANDGRKGVKGNSISQEKIPKEKSRGVMSKPGSSYKVVNLGRTRVEKNNALSGTTPHHMTFCLRTTPPITARVGGEKQKEEPHASRLWLDLL
jgi:hypothetical protein